MHGNVIEWCLDHYVKDAYARFLKGSKDGISLSPVFPPTENKWSHVARGGRWKDAAPELRSAARRASQKEWMKDDPQVPQSIWWLTKFDIVGFRVVRPLDEQPELKGLTAKVVKSNDETFAPK